MVPRLGQNKVYNVIGLPFIRLVSRLGPKQLFNDKFTGLSSPAVTDNCYTVKEEIAQKCIPYTVLLSFLCYIFSFSGIRKNQSYGTACCKSNPA